MKKLVIGIDESYTKTGIGIAINGKLKKLRCWDLHLISDNSGKRNAVRTKLDQLLMAVTDYDFDEIVIIVERITLKRFSAPRTNPKTGKVEQREFINQDYIKNTAALIACIVDTAREYDVEVYSVDTRSWKAQVLGSAKSKRKKVGVKARKETSVEKIISLGFEDKIRYETKTGVKYNDDMADAGCIALYGFIPEKNQKLKREK